MKPITIIAGFAVLAIAAHAVADTRSPRPGVTLESETADPRLNDMAVATAVEDLEPAGASESFPADVGKLYCWLSAFTSSDTTLTVRWTWDGTAMGERQVEIRRSIRFRQWVTKRINPRFTGNWTCEVLDAGGGLLGSAQFTLQ